MPEFPFEPSAPPLCKNKTCNLPCKRVFTAKGRPVYGCPCQPEGAWCTYDDSEGVSSENPACKCGYFCRKDFSAKNQKEFLKCPVGRCNVFIWLDQAPAAQNLSIIGEGFAQTPPQLGPQAPSHDVDGEFVRLLRHVEAAAPVATFPSQIGMVDSRSVGNPSQESLANLQIGSSSGLDRNEKVGAAGEYFVSNIDLTRVAHQCTSLMAKVLLLLHHTLSGQVDGRHWRSRTRNAVKKHLGHSDWPEYTEDEDDADIVFFDEHSSLTNLLIAKGFLDPQSWRGRQVNYLIEVKSTLGSRSKEFYLSNKQFHRVCLERSDQSNSN
jgi:hypothetical protein